MAGRSGRDQGREKPVADTWFSVAVCGDQIFRFHEHHIDPYAVGDFWLVRGAERAVVVDTGSGVLSPAPLVQALAGVPVLAVAMNSYYDHAGGWHGFSQRACHPLDAPDLENPSSENSSISTYLNDETLWSLPWDGFRLSDYAMTPAQATSLLQEGDRIDLGDRSLEVLHLPGRSPGGMGLWEPATGSLFTSDMLYDGDHGPAWPPDEPNGYCESLKRLRDLPVKRVFPGHYGLMDRPRMLTLINAQLKSLEMALSE